MLRPSTAWRLGPATCAQAYPRAVQRTMVSASPARTGGPVRPVLLFDVMDTIVYDPFFKDMPTFFQMSFQELLKAKHPTAWVEFECNRIDERELCRIFFADGRPVDYEGLVAMLRVGEPGRSDPATDTWMIIEDKLRLSRYMPWTFVSCTGPMEGVRKPAPEAYQRVISHLGLPPSHLLFIDDRKPNVEAALAQDVPALLFTGSQQLEQDLLARGLQF